MFKTVTAFLFLAAISLQILNKAVIYVDYYANTAAYVKNCQNKARPQMHCNGKCQMMKKLQQEEKKDSQVPERKSVNDEVISFKSSFTGIVFFYAPQRSSYNFFPASCTVNRPRSCFHPPGV